MNSKRMMNYVKIAISMNPIRKKKRNSTLCENLKDNSIVLSLFLSKSS